MPFCKIKEITGFATSTANDIWRYAIKNARQARVTGDDPDDVRLSLPELIASSNLDANPRSGRPSLLNNKAKDKLIEFVKKNFETRRMTIQDIGREDGFAHVSDTTIYRALLDRGIRAYHEEFKIILKEEKKKKRLVSWL